MNYESLASMRHRHATIAFIATELPTRAAVNALLSHSFH